MMGMPKYNDDYWYMWQLRPWFESQGILVPEGGGNIFSAGFPWREILQTWEWHYLHDNARLGNMLAPVLLMFPKWVGSGLMTLMVGSIVFMSFKLAGVDWRRSALVPPALFAWTFCLPWRDHLAVLDFQLNYIFSAWLALLLLIYLLERRGKRCGYGGIIGGFLLGVATGMSHEVVAVPVTVGVLALMLAERDFRNRRVLLVLTGLAVGILLLATCPGMWERFQASPPKDRTPWVRMFNLRDSLPFAVMVMLFLWSLARKGLRTVANGDVMIYSFATVLMSLVMIYVCFFPGRIWFFINVMVIIVSMRLIRLNWDSAFGHYRWWSVILSVFVLGCAYVHLVAVDYYSFVFRRLQKDYIETYLSSPESQVFGKVLTLGNLSPAVGYLPETAFYEKSLLYVPEYYGKYGDSMGTETVVIPEELKYVGAMSGESLGGGPVRRLSGFYYAPRELMPERDAASCVTLDIDFGSGAVPIYAFVAYFTSHADGKEYCWIVPDMNWRLSHFKQVKAVSVAGDK